MRHDRGSGRIYDTLGFYINGIPALFVRTDIVFGVEPALAAYRAFSTGTQQILPRGPAGTDLLRGFELGATFIHELRHFHDALLSRSLFMLFVLRSTMNWNVLQLASRLRHEMPGRLPLDLKSAARRATGDLAPLLRTLEQSSRRYAALERRFYSPRLLRDGRSITATHLLETNAVLSELFSLLLDHGERFAETYYVDVVRRLDPEYWLLLDTAIVQCGGFLRAIFGLHFTVSASLWMDRNPVDTFNELFPGLSPSVADKISAGGWSPILNIFDDEDTLRQRIAAAPIVDLAGHIFDAGQLPTEGRRILEVFRRIYDARSTLISHYVKDSLASPLRYAEGIPGLPLPAIFFLPGESSKDRGYLDGIRLAHLRERDDLYVIRGHDDGTEGLAVIAGLVAFPGGKPCIDFDLVDLSITLRYCYDRLFGSSTRMFTEEVDEVYAGLFDRVMLGATG